MSGRTSAPETAAHARNITARAIGLGVVLLVVAALVAVVRGGMGTAPHDVSLGAATGDTTQKTVEVTLADMRITPSRIAVAPGTRLVLEVTNADAMTHDLTIDTGVATPLLGRGESATLEAGVITTDHEGWCSVPGHRAAGMTMSIVVTGASADGAHGHSGHGTGGSSGASAEQGTSSAVSGDDATIDPEATPGVDWQPVDPNLKPAPGGTEHKIRIEVRDTLTEVAPGVKQTMWAFNGTVPGPTLHGKVGDVFTVTFVNGTQMGHGIDFHASAVSPDKVMRELAPGQSVTYQFVAHGAGAWLYHCSTTPMSLHIANGMFGAVIIDPPGLRHVDRELLLVQSELYFGPQGGTADEQAIADDHPSAVVFNGYPDQYMHDPVTVRAGDRVRIWVVDAGPQHPSSFHLVGSPFDTVFKEGAYQLKPGNKQHGMAQSLDLAPGQGGFVETVLPAVGHYTFMDHYLVDGEAGAMGVLWAR